MVQVAWTEEAVRRVEDIRRYIRQFNPRAAERMAARLYAAGDGLDMFPERGRSTESGLRELPTVRPYVITYEIVGDTVYILTIRHGRQQPSD